ncbi:hypothetical protein HPB47_009442 [Ixodes persulcatus]|uniref:Uncharacterized protein n=1 Tax=Ixodes persulcatus TaxID=34615 RepID=A0AC60P1Y2_IXOPE|nr:hypothetical protein HPB47_009442 [Ixodes persulcatus]
MILAAARRRMWTSQTPVPPRVDLHLDGLFGRFGSRHTFDDYPKGVRYVRFAHLGTDTQFWAGHYGAKMAGGMVRIAAEQTNPTSTAASCETADKTSEPQHS